jgi:hypothetical protein
MSNKNGDNLAYPLAYTVDGFVQPSFGLTKRELFAAMAMQGFCANVKASTQWDGETRAQKAVRQADALLDALGEGEK